VERAALTLGVLVLFVAGYFGVGGNVDPSRARQLATSVDDRIPFIARSVWVYLWVFPASLLPLFLVRCPRLFRRAMLSYGIAIAVSLAVFAAMPVTSIGLRRDRSTLDVTQPSAWAVSVLYAVDPPLNLFPSLHLSIAVLASLAAGKARRSYGAAAFVGVVLVAASICTVKQHFVLDGLGGAALAGVIHAAVLRPYRARSRGSTRPGGARRRPTRRCFRSLYVGLYLGFRLAA
jgi:membrane-associated phospholipid phosphatase